MPKGWLYHLGRHDRNGKADLETRLVESLLVVCLSVCLRYL